MLPEKKRSRSDSTNINDDTIITVRATIREGSELGSSLYRSAAVSTLPAVDAVDAAALIFGTL